MQATTACNSTRKAKSFSNMTKTYSPTIGMHLQVELTTWFSTNNSFRQRYHRATEQHMGGSSASTAKKIIVH